MTPLASAATGLQGALLLARGRPEGAALMEPGAGGATRSFWAIAACVPIILMLRVAGDAAGGTAAALGAALVGWLGFAVLSHGVVRAMGAGERWFGFIAAWNWCSVVQHSLLALGSVPGLAGLAGPLPVVTALLATGWAIWLEWFATRVTLGVGGPAAAMLVLLDFAIGVVAFNLGSAP